MPEGLDRTCPNSAPDTQELIASTTLCLTGSILVDVGVQQFAESDVRHPAGRGFDQCLCRLGEDF
jgi:hypothetical protein